MPVGVRSIRTLASWSEISQNGLCGDWDRTKKIASIKLPKLRSKKMPKRHILSKGIDQIDRRVTHKGVKINPSPLLNRIPVYPPLQIGIVEAVEVIIHPAVGVDFFAG